MYNVTKQAKEQDPDGSFIRTHVPELQAVPDEHVHEPWRMPLSVQHKCRVRVTTAVAAADGCSCYPPPIVDAEQAARVAKEKISAVRKTAEARAQAQQVYEKHGSRKDHQGSRSDFAQQEAAAKTKPRKRALPAGQTTLAQHLLIGSSNAPKKPRPATNDQGDDLSDAAARSCAVGQWVCAKCTLLNRRAEFLACEACGSERKA